MGKSYVLILAVTLNFSATIGKIKQGPLSILELFKGNCTRVFILELISRIYFVKARMPNLSSAEEQ